MATWPSTFPKRSARDAKTTGAYGGVLKRQHPCPGFARARDGSADLISLTFAVDGEGESQLELDGNPLRVRDCEVALGASFRRGRSPPGPGKHALASVTGVSLRNSPEPLGAGRIQTVRNPEVAPTGFEITLSAPVPDIACTAIAALAIARHQVSYATLHAIVESFDTNPDYERSALHSDSLDNAPSAHF